MNVQATKIKETRSRLEAERALSELLNTARSRDQRRRNVETPKQKKSQQVVNQLNKDSANTSSSLTEKGSGSSQPGNRTDHPGSDGTRQVADTTESSKRALVDYKLAGQFEANKGKLPWPAEGPVVDHFGQHYHPVFTKVKRSTMAFPSRSKELP